MFFGELGTLNFYLLWTQVTTSDKGHLNQNFILFYNANMYEEKIPFHRSRRDNMILLWTEHQTLQPGFEHHKV